MRKLDRGMHQFYRAVVWGSDRIEYTSIIDCSCTRPTAVSSVPAP